jgi:type IV secretory pathway TrbF-like protein
VLRRKQPGIGMEGSVYLKARQEWDERYADLVLGKPNGQIAVAGEGDHAGAGFRDGLGQHAKSVDSYVVEVDKLGCAIGAASGR